MLACCYSLATSLSFFVLNYPSSVLCYYLLIFQQDPEDLSFKKGDVLTVISKEEDDWWLARHSNGQEGLIPRPYVEEVGF